MNIWNLILDFIELISIPRYDLDIIKFSNFHTSSSNKTIVNSSWASSKLTNFNYLPSKHIKWSLKLYRISWFSIKPWKHSLYRLRKADPEILIAINERENWNHWAIVCSSYSFIVATYQLINEYVNNIKLNKSYS